MESFLKERQHLRQLVVRVHIVYRVAALLQQSNDVFILYLLVHLELFEGITKTLKKRSEIIVVGEVDFRELQKYIRRLDFYIQLHTVSHITTFHVQTLNYRKVIPHRTTAERRWDVKLSLSSSMSINQSATQNEYCWQGFLT